jgi:uncharacterized membrane protein YuzA (DUF378 family)
MKGLHVVSWILLVIGGLNWLLVGLGGWNLVDKLLGVDSIGAKIVYILVGLAALVELFTHKKNCSCCKKSGDAPAM